jgi:hypothetical protein
MGELLARSLREALSISVTACGTRASETGERVAVTTIGATVNGRPVESVRAGLWVWAERGAPTSVSARRARVRRGENIVDPG